MELPHAHAPDLRCCGRLRGHPRRDGGQSRPRGGVLLPPDLPAVPALVRSRTPSDNNRSRRGDRARDEAAEPVKPSTGTRAKRDEEKSTSSGKSGKSQAKSEASSSQASRTRSVHQEPPPSKSSGRANASVRRESPAGGGAPAAAPPVQPSAPSANAAAQAPSSARVGSTLGDTFDEKLGEVFKARIDELIKQSN